MVTYEWGVGQIVDHKNLTQPRIKKHVYTNLVNTTSNMTRNHYKDVCIRRKLSILSLKQYIRSIVEFCTAGLSILSTKFLT